MAKRKSQSKVAVSKSKSQTKPKEEVVHIDAEKFNSEFKESLSEASNSPEIQKLYDYVQVFHDGCRNGHSKRVKETDPLTEDDNNSLDECIRMVGLSAHCAAISYIVRGLVAYRIQEERLWRGKFKNAKECVQDLFKQEYSAAARYIQSGRVLYHITKQHSLKEIPENLEFYAKFSKLKNESDIVPVFEEVMKKAEGKSSKDAIFIAKQVVAKKLGKPIPKKKVDAKDSKDNQGKPTVAENKNLDAQEQKELIKKHIEDAIELFENYNKTRKKSGKNRTMCIVIDKFIDMYQQWSADEE